MSSENPPFGRAPFLPDPADTGPTPDPVFLSGPPPAPEPVVSRIGLPSLPDGPTRATTSPLYVVAPPSQLAAAPAGLQAVAPPASHPEAVRVVTPTEMAQPVAPPTRNSPATENAPVAPPTASHVGVVQVAAEEATGSDFRLDPLLLHLMEVGGSDLHLSAGSKPRVRVRGEMTVVDNTDVLTPDSIQTAIYTILNAKQQKAFEEHLELDFAYSIQGEGRFRANIFRQRGSVGAVFRTIPWEIKSLESLKMPTVLNNFSRLPRGLVLVTGPTGSGKSTTLAAIIDQANRTRSGHIMTIEDPIEFLHQHRLSVVNQRQVGEDTSSFAEALKRVLRQDPDIILVGELRDLETISVALTAAETGHLVFATLHTQSASETITRLVDVFPPAQQSQVRTQLSATLHAVVCQELCKTADGNGRIAAVEIMICDTGIRSMIRDGKLQQISGALETGSKNGSQTLNQHLASLVLGGQISYDTAREKCTSKDDLETILNGKHGPDRKLDSGGSFIATSQPGPRSSR